MSICDAVRSLNLVPPLLVKQQQGAAYGCLHAAPILGSKAAGYLLHVLNTAADQLGDVPEEGERLWDSVVLEGSYPCNKTIATFAQQMAAAYQMDLQVAALAGRKYQQLAEGVRSCEKVSARPLTEKISAFLDLMSDHKELRSAEWNHTALLFDVQRGKRDNATSLALRLDPKGKRPLEIVVPSPPPVLDVLDLDEPTCKDLKPLWRDLLELRLNRLGNLHSVRCLKFAAEPFDGGASEVFSKGVSEIQALNLEYASRFNELDEAIETALSTLIRRKETSLCPQELATMVNWYTHWRGYDLSTLATLRYLREGAIASLDSCRSIPLIKEAAAKAEEGVRRESAQVEAEAARQGSRREELRSWASHLRSLPARKPQAPLWLHNPLIAAVALTALAVVGLYMYQQHFEERMRWI